MTLLIIILIIIAVAVGVWYISKPKGQKKSLPMVIQKKSPMPASQASGSIKPFEAPKPFMPKPVPPVSSFSPRPIPPTPPMPPTPPTPPPPPPSNPPTV